MALGLDGLLYGLANPVQVQVFNPDTLTSVRTVALQGGPDSDIRSIAVDSSGHILAATWSGYVVKYDAKGNFLASTHSHGTVRGRRKPYEHCSGHRRSDSRRRPQRRDLPHRRIARHRPDDPDQAATTFVTFNHYISPVQVLSVSDVTVKGTTTYSLNEYTQQGVLISTQPIPQAPGATENENARGLSVDPSGNIDIYDGTLTPPWLPSRQSEKPGPIRLFPAGTPSIPTATAKSRPTITSCSLLT